MSEKRFNPAKLAKLDHPERRKALPPEKLLAILPINNQDAILDIGAGTGYFAIPAAKITNGTVYALDVAPQMLAALQERAEEAGVANVQYVEGVIEEIPLPDQLVEHVIASLVLHEVEPLDRGLQEIHRLLKPGGTCFCLEWEKKETEQGPPLDHRIGSSELAEAFASAGFEIVARQFPTDAHYILVARKSE